jgi:signal-transduction protein with cAMP-binding, CBS, and nucleotidyltransferase domain
MLLEKFSKIIYPVSHYNILTTMPKVKDLMTKGALTIDKSKTIVEAADLMAQKGVGYIIVLDGETPRGIVTERDFVRRVIAKRKPLYAKISDIMTKPLITIGPEASLSVAARRMVNNKIRRLPVMKHHKLIGIIVVSDFAKHFSKKTLTESVLEAIWRSPTPQ